MLSPTAVRGLKQNQETVCGEGVFTTFIFWKKSIMDLPPRPTMREFVLREEGGTQPALEEGEEILATVDGVVLAFDPEIAEGKGAVIVTSSRICWIADTSDKAYEFDVPYITLHAISRDPSTYPTPCIYCQLGEEDLRETFFAPSEEQSLQIIFDAFSRAAELNPDPPEPGEQEGDDELFFDEDQARAGSILNHLESVFTVGNGVHVQDMQDEEEEVEEGQFDDPEEDENDHMNT